MKLSQYVLARVTLFLTLFLLGIISIVSYQKIHELIEFDKKVLHTYRVLFNFEKVMSTLKGAESGQRGYLIARDSTFLQSFFDSKKNADSLLESLITLTSDNAVQTRRLDSLQILIRKRYELMNLAIHLEATQNIRKEILFNSLLQGKAVMDEIRGVIDRLQLEEESLLFIRTKEKDELIVLTPIFSLILAFFSLLLLLFSYFVLVRELKRKTVMQLELENKVEELNRSNSDLEQFAYVASHDLQEPLRKIRSFGDRLLYKYSENLSDDAKFNVSKMQDAAVRMQKLIDDLLNFSRVVQSENKFEITNLNEIIHTVINDLDEQVKSSGAQIHISNLPVVNAVPSQIRQLFQNLLSNALKFSKDNEAPEINILYSIVKGNEIKDGRLAAANEYFHRIIFSDNGIGFDEQYLDRIFVIFQRLHGKMEYSGTGIGLAVSKKIVLNHSGYITARSKPGHGASFYVYLPVKY